MREDKNETRGINFYIFEPWGGMIPIPTSIDFLMNRHHIVCWNVWQMPVTSAKEIR